MEKIKDSFTSPLTTQLDSPKVVSYISFGDIQCICIYMHLFNIKYNSYAKLDSFSLNYIPQISLYYYFRAAPFLMEWYAVSFNFTFPFMSQVKHIFIFLIAFQSCFFKKTVYSCPLPHFFFFTRLLVFSQLNCNSLQIKENYLSITL